MNEVAIYNSFPSTDELKNLQLIATTAAKSGIYKGSPEAIIMTLLTARELNVGPMLALNGGINNIQGRVELSARLMGVLIRRSGHTVKAIELTKDKCTLVGIRADTKEQAEATFTFEDAKKAGLFKLGGGWDKYPEDMCYARALSRLARRLFPDVIGNCYVEGEISQKDPAKMPVSECEDVTPDCTDEVTIPENPKISDAQVVTLSEMAVKIEDEFKVKMNAWLIENVKTDKFEDLLASSYEKVWLRINNHLKWQEHRKLEASIA